MPENRLAANLDHGLGLKVGLLGDAGPEPTGEDDNLHASMASVASLRHSRLFGLFRSFGLFGLFGLVEHNARFDVRGKGLS